MRHAFVFTCVRRVIVFQVGQLSTASSGAHLRGGRKHLLGTSPLQCENPTLVSGFVQNELIWPRPSILLNKNMLHLYPLAAMYIPVFCAGTLWCFSFQWQTWPKLTGTVHKPSLKIPQYLFKAGGCGFKSQLGWAFPGGECMSPIFNSSRFLPTELKTHRFGLTLSSHIIHECKSVYECLSPCVSALKETCNLLDWLLRTGSGSPFMAAECKWQQLFHHSVSSFIWLWFFYTVFLKVVYVSSKWRVLSCFFFLLHI